MPASPDGMSLKEYRRKRHFKKTPEPPARPSRISGTTRRSRTEAAPLSFVVQQHHARRLHWDFRLESEGVLKSWAVTREPSLDPKVRRLAIETEDHPLAYGGFEGQIPAGEYGAGKVLIWDRGTFEPKRPVAEAMESGLIEVTLKGRKLKGRFVLVRVRDEGPKSQWLFFKAKPRIADLEIPDVDTLLANKRARKSSAA